MPCPTCARKMVRIGESGLSFLFRCELCGTIVGVHDVTKEVDRTYVPQLVERCREALRDASGRSGGSVFLIHRAQIQALRECVNPPDARPQ